MDATVRDLDAVGAMGAKVSFQSLDVDTFTYSVPLRDVVPTTEILPENGQKVVLYRNGVKFFQGHAQRSQSGYMISVTVYGAWWWLQRLTMTQTLADSAAASSNRVTYGFPTQNLTTSLAAAVTRSAALGAPIAGGSFAGTFTCPPITLNQSTCGDVIAELVRLTPDVMPWFDYSTTTPTFNTARRSSATVRTLAIGSAPLETWNVNPQIELKAEFVRLPYVKRGTTGKRVWGEQLSGDAGTAQSGTTTTIRLRTTASTLDDAYNGCSVSILSGTGAGQSSSITAYTGSSRTATVSPSWITAPNSTSVYQVGSGLAGGNGTTHILTVSGQELDTFLPNELFDSATLKTISPTTLGTDFTNLVYARDQTIQQLLTKFGAFTNYSVYNDAPQVMNGSSLTIYEGSVNLGKYTISFTRQYMQITYKDTATGTTLSTSGKYLLVSGEVPSWFGELGKTAIDATVTLEYMARCRGSSESNELANEAPWLTAMPVDNPANHGDVMKGYLDVNAPAQWGTHKIRRASFAVKLLDVSYATATTIYRPADYDFIKPPPGFAAGLQESQGFVPYIGSLTLREQDAGGTRYRGCVVNLTGGLPELATMKALVQSEEIDLDSGTTTLTLGAPARLSYQDFVSRIRKTSQDNIVYL